MIEVKERPIIMQARSIKGILEGRKTQTRRIVKRLLKHPNWTGYMMTAKQDGAIECGPDYPDDKSDCVKCPYGQPGDRLWVREAHHILDARPENLASAESVRPAGPWSAYVTYKADDHLTDCVENVSPDEWRPSFDNDHVEWRSSIHMPRWASRLTLEITGIRVERVQNISEEDCKAEGLIRGSHGWYGGEGTKDAPGSCFNVPRNAFGNWWNLTNGAGVWERNDWVWAVEFRRLP